MIDQKSEMASLKMLDEQIGKNYRITAKYLGPIVGGSSTKKSYYEGYNSNLEGSSLIQQQKLQNSSVKIQESFKTPKKGQQLQSQDKNSTNLKFASMEDDYTNDQYQTKTKSKKDTNNDPEVFSFCRKDEQIIEETSEKQEDPIGQSIRQSYIDKNKEIQVNLYNNEFVRINQKIVEKSNLPHFNSVDPSHQELENVDFIERDNLVNLRDSNNPISRRSRQYTVHEEESNLNEMSFQENKSQKNTANLFNESKDNVVSHDTKISIQKECSALGMSSLGFEKVSQSFILDCIRLQKERDTDEFVMKNVMMLIDEDDAAFKKIDDRRKFILTLYDIKVWQIQKSEYFYKKKKELKNENMDVYLNELITENYDYIEIIDLYMKKSQDTDSNEGRSDRKKLVDINMFQTNQESNQQSLEDQEFEDEQMVVEENVNELFGKRTEWLDKHYNKNEVELEESNITIRNLIELEKAKEGHFLNHGNNMRKTIDNSKKLNECESFIGADNYETDKNYNRLGVNDVDLENYSTAKKHK